MAIATALLLASAAVAASADAAFDGRYLVLRELVSLIETGKLEDSTQSSIVNRAARTRPDNSSENGSGPEGTLTYDDVEIRPCSNQRPIRMDCVRYEEGPCSKCASCGRHEYADDGFGCCCSEDEPLGRCVPSLCAVLSKAGSEGLAKATV